MSGGRNSFAAKRLFSAASVPNDRAPTLDAGKLGREGVDRQLRHGPLRAKARAAAALGRVSALDHLDHQLTHDAAAASAQGAPPVDPNHGPRAELSASAEHGSQYDRRRPAAQAGGVTPPHLFALSVGLNFLNPIQAIHSRETMRTPFDRLLRPGMRRSLTKISPSSLTWRAELTVSDQRIRWRWHERRRRGRLGASSSRSSNRSLASKGRGAAPSVAISLATPHRQTHKVRRPAGSVRRIAVQLPNAFPLRSSTAALLVVPHRRRPARLHPFAAPCPFIVAQTLRLHP
jgi:hypothetical protein